MNEIAKPADWTAQEPAPAPESYHIEATKSLVDRTLRTLKHDDLFGVFDKQGDCRGGEGAPDGLYFQDTRFLSGLSLKIGGLSPLLLGSVVLDDNGAMVVDLANADFHDDDGRVWLQRDSIHASRVKFLCGTVCYERIRVRGFGPVGRTIPLDLAFAADFADLFEVRGERRARRGTLKVERLDGRSVRFSYLGLDAVERTTTLHFDPAPDDLSDRHARWEMDLDANERVSVVVKMVCTLTEPGAAPEAEPAHMLSAYRKVRRASGERLKTRASVTSANELFNTVVDRAASDIDMLLTDTAWGLYPYAGIPWYSTIFGRDGIVTAMELLWAAPEIAKGVLTTLAATQATETDEAADAEPGKILHETRGGEMARLGEVPFRLYYGSVDATPLFVMLAGQYLKRSGDIETIRAIWPNIKAALAWIDGAGDPDGDGFVEYARMTDKGLANQGWKDSFDSIFHADGRAAEGPIALCEVQAYVFAAKRAAAEMARALGEDAQGYERQAEALRQRFEDLFWLDDLGCYALALDGRKQPCRVLSSNAGHALFAGIASPERAARLARLLTGKSFFSGWGVRTIAAGQARYNPMSYHNGSVWPHDNALIAMGLARYGHKKEVLQIFQGLAEAAVYDEFRRLPELFCGFSRRRKRGPTSYPVACSPQAWAAAAPFALVAAATGLELDHASGGVRLVHPGLPAFLDDLTLRDVRLAGARLDLRLSRSGDDVTTAVTRREGKAGLTIVK
ncbi:MAG TPA: glycogen debranching N-terminal domain-containing protein [Allosphingosinicella sp.]|jgi:glycogen debranching enzyme|nr:glycogen debranching N-terminal domain-containing protein [Allosphingosinicella sp.]